MCGIVGMLERGRDADAATLDRMNQQLVHRGPDDGGAWCRGPAAIAMRRLSIVDVAGGHQPIANEAGSCWIVFNGEIYNHRSLHRELVQSGHRFRTNSDTEVILHLYEEGGVDAIRRLDGMFAFAIVDLRGAPNEPRVVLARDRFGKKPLYYADSPARLVFGSELKALLASGLVPRELDADALHHYLSLLMVPEPFCILKGVRKLPAGCALIADHAGSHVERYWDHSTMFRAADNAHVERGSLVEQIRDLLFASVEKRLDLEVPFGAFLSGGLDSGAVVGLMSRVLARPVRTYSIGFEGPATHNELPAAALTARHYRTEHHELLVKPDVVELLHDLVEYADEPLAISSSLPLLLLARAARRDVKVVLTGDGGDEAFGGYDQYRFERWARWWRQLPGAADRVVHAAATSARRLDSMGPLARRLRQVERFVGNARRPRGARRLGWASGFDEVAKHDIYLPAFRSSRYKSTPAWIEGRIAAFADLPDETQANAADLLIWLPDEMLAKVDRATMAASLEARSPLLDDALVERLMRVPFKHKLEGRVRGRAKPLLRAALADVLPPHLMDGRKWGFNVPLDAWFRGAAGSFVASTLSTERVHRRGVFDPAAVQALISSHAAGEINAANRLFALVVFEIWAERYLS